MTDQRLYTIYYKTKDRVTRSSFDPMTFKEALIVRSKCISSIKYKHRLIEVRRVS